MQIAKIFPRLHLNFINNQDQYLYIFIHINKCAGSTIGSHISQTYHPDQYLQLYAKEVLAHQQSNHGDRYEFNHYFRHEGLRIRKQWVADLIESIPAKKKKSIRYLYGHLTYYGIHDLFDREPRYFIFLRHPVSRTLSHYNYLVSKRPDRLKYFKIMEPKDNRILPFEEWLTMDIPPASNHMSWFLSRRIEGDWMSDYHSHLATRGDLENAEELLSRMYFVGLTETKYDLDFIYYKLKIKRILQNQNVSKSQHIFPLDPEILKNLILSRNKLDQELYDHAICLRKAKIATIKDYEKSSSYLSSLPGL
jgi:hypothetical protein